MKKPEIIYNINDLTCLTSASDADVIPQELFRTNHPDCDKTRQLQGTTLEKSTQKPFNRMTMRQKQDLYTRRMIRFSLKNPAQPLTSIRMRMTINHVRMSYALAPTFKIEPKHWDSTEGRAIVDSKRNADLKGNPRLRVRLDNINTEIDKITNAVLAVLAGSSSRASAPRRIRYATNCNANSDKRQARPGHSATYSNTSTFTSTPAGKEPSSTARAHA